MIIERHFVRVDGRLVHFRKTGTGPVVLLINQSPKSSEDNLPLIKLLGNKYTVIATDNPGNGLSEPLPVKSSGEVHTVEEFGDAVARFLDSLSIQRCLVYGFHTGAAIALAFASRHPDRVASVSVFGIPVMSKEQAEQFSALYLPPWEPKWDGSHLIWLWARLREQKIFFPWYKTEEDCRIYFPFSSKEIQTTEVMDVLRVGDNYRQVYRAALCCPTIELIDNTRCPMLFISAEWDLLYKEMELIPDVPQPLKRIKLGLGKEEHIPHLLDWFEQWQDKADSRLDELKPSDVTFVQGLRVRRDMSTYSVATNSVADKKQVRALVVLHDHADDIDGEEVADISARHPSVIQIDLPGHGESIQEWPETEDIAVVVLSVLAEICPQGADIIGCGLGMVIAQLMADTYPDYSVHAESRPYNITLEQWQTGSDLLAQWSLINAQGAHLLAAWQMARDSAIFDPWCAAEPSAAKASLGSMDPVDIHRRALAAIKSRGAWCAAWQLLKPDVCE